MNAKYDIAKANDCKNQESSYGHICVRCNKCGRFDNQSHIKEMANILYDYTKKHGIMASVVILENYAETLYNAGYRKQVWRDVSDPPETSGLYIVCTDKGSVFTAHYYADCGRFNEPFKKSVVRWTEMPEAPREG